MKDIVFYLKAIMEALQGIGGKMPNKSVISVTDIKALTKEQLDSIDCGDVVVKITGKQRHTYIVTYKGDGAGEGICLTYTAAGYGETVSYDRSGDSWVFNSVDVKTYGD